VSERSELARDDVDQLGLPAIIGSRLREHRRRRRVSLRDTAERAGISQGHLSDIEHGNSHASLPVLVRLCRALQLPIAELLPRLGGARVLRSTSTARRPGVERISHGGLELRVDRVTMRRGGSVRFAVDPSDDVFLFVVDGSCTASVAGSVHQLERHDAVDAERVEAIAIDSERGAALLVVRATRR
jgi:transcriptional regulator with XRE-family HTH domain